MSNYKTGFNYYNIDTDRYQDIRIKRLKKDFGCNGIAIYDYLLCEIYRVKGCFLMWDENTSFDVAEYFGLEETQVVEIVNFCGEVGLFDGEILTRESALTSSSIQRRFTEMSGRAKRKTAKIPDKYMIIPEESTKIQEESIQNDVGLPQSRVEKSKEKKSKVEKKREEGNPRAPDLSESNLYRRPRIPTKEDVHLAFLQKGGTIEMAESFYNRSEGTGWFFKGSPVTNFKTLISNFITNWKKNEDRRSGIDTDKLAKAAEGQRIADERTNAIFTSRTFKGSSTGN